MLAVVAAVTLSAVALIACGEGGDTQTVTETIREETTTAVEDGAASDNSQPEPTDGPVKSGGIEVAVTDAYAKQAVSYEGGTIDSRVTPNGEPRTVRAPQGGSYVYVETNVMNDSSEGLDLTCGYPMEVKLVEASGRRFDPVEGLDLVKGNPACNAQLQPGFRDGMTWVFLVPPDAEVNAFRFRDTTDLSKEQPPAEIAVSGI